VTDEQMPNMSGAEFLSRVRELYPQTVRIMLTGHASLEAAMRAVNTGEIYRFFLKPWDDVVLRLAVRSAFEKFDLEDENRRLLATVRRQAMDIKTLERKYPGISSLRRDGDGVFVMPEVTQKDKDDILAELEEEFG